MNTNSTFGNPIKTWLTLLLLLSITLAGCNTDSSGGSSGNASGPTAPPKDAVVVRFLFTSEKKDWFGAALQRYNAGNNKTQSGKTIVVESTITGSVETVNEILAGTQQPALWSPASRIMIPLLNDGWATKNGKDLVTEQCKDAALSPLVIMMWKPVAEALGWPDKPIGWADIAALATNPQGFAAPEYNKPQLGKFRFGHTHPDYSNSGLQTIVALTYAAVGKTRGLTVEDVNKPEVVKLLQEVESAVAHYGSSTGFFADSMIKRGTAYLSAAAVYENSVATSYDPTKSPELPLVAIYPKEGTFLSDHPLCIPDGSWLTADQREAAELVRSYLLSDSIQQEALRYGFRPASPAIAIGDPITKARGVDPQQPASTLDVPRPAVIRAIQEIWQAQKRQVNLTLVIDISGSMNDEGKITGARTGAKAFIDQLAPSDNLTLVVFNSSSTTVFENLNVGENRDRMKREVDSLIANGGTALYDAVAQAVKTMKLDPTRINALVVLSDGDDRNSQTYRSVGALIDALKADSESTGLDVSVFTIGYGSGANESILKQIAEALRGAYRKGGSADIIQVYREISTFF